MKGMDLSMVPYGRSTKGEGENGEGDVVETKPFDKSRRLNIEPVVEPVVMNPKSTKIAGTKYRECMRNHAASIGGHANDGCGEFMPGGDDGSGDSLTCAACGCHRNFHRREVGGTLNHHHHLLHSPPAPPMLLYNAGPTTPRWDKKIGGFAAAVPALSLPQSQPFHPRHRNGGGMFGDVDHDNDVDRQYDRRSETPEREEVQVGTTTTTSSRNKRYRTKFTQEQKDRMLEFAERLGWRIQKHDDVALTQFCSEIGIKRNVLKVWMHNNKNAHRRRETAPQSPVAPPPPPPPAPPQPVGV